MGHGASAIAAPTRAMLGFAGGRQHVIRRIEKTRSVAGGAAWRCALGADHGGTHRARPLGRVICSGLCACRARRWRRVACAGGDSQHETEGEHGDRSAARKIMMALVFFPALQEMCGLRAVDRLDDHTVVRRDPATCWFRERNSSSAARCRRARLRARLGVVEIALRVMTVGRCCPTRTPGRPGRCRRARRASRSCASTASLCAY